MPQSAEQCARSSGFVAVHKTEGVSGNLIYILVDDRRVFDLIDLPEGGNERVRHKAIDQGTGGQYIIFQYWLDKAASRIDANVEAGNATIC